MGKLLKRNLLAKITCLILSLGLWMYIITIENPVKRRTFFDIPITYSNVDQLRSKELVLTPGQNLVSDITVEGSFREILQKKSSDITLVLDFAGKSLVEGENKVPITAVLPNGMVQRGSIEKTIYLEPLVPKRFNVKSALTLETTDKSLYAPQPVIDTVVEVTGPKSVVEQVANVVAKESFTGLDVSTDKIVKLVPVDKEGKEIKSSLTLDKSYTSVSINVYPVKDVKINEKTTGKINDGLMLKSAKSNIDTVRIAGPKAVLDTLKTVDTEEVPLDKVSLNQTEFPVKLQLPKDVFLLDENNKLLENSFVVKVDVEAKPSKKISKEITISGKAQGNQVSIEGKKTVTIQVSGDKAKLESLDSASISAQVDVNNLPVGKGEVEVKVTLPSEFTLISVDPAKVTVVVAP